mgnify:CR=1 FL=1
MDFRLVFGHKAVDIERTFKVVELVPQGRALQQLKDRAYADKYRARGEPIHLVGVEFGKVERNIAGFEVETIRP